MSLSLAQLDEAAKLLQPCMDHYRELIDYARERAAREACEAAVSVIGWRMGALTKTGNVWTAEAHPVPSYASVPERWEGTHLVGGGTMWLGKADSGSTPTAAYLALLEKLAVR